MKTKSMVHRGIQSASTPHAPLVTARSRPLYESDTALILTSPEGSGSADELNMGGSRSETQSKRAGSLIHQPLPNSPERKQRTSRRERNILQSPARGARAGARAIGKRRENRAAKVVPLPSKERARRPSQDLPLNGQPPDRTISSRISPHCSHSQRLNKRASRAVVASTSSSKVVLRQKPSSSDRRSPTTPGDGLSFTALVQPKTLSESLLPSSDRMGPPKKEDDLIINRLIREKPDKKPLPTLQKGKGIPVPSTSTNDSPFTWGSNSSTQSGRKRFESNGGSSSYQMGVPWADVVNIPSLSTPMSRGTRSSKSSQDSSTFPMHLTPPDFRMKKQATLESGIRRSPKRKRPSIKEASDFSDECGIVPESQKKF